MSGTPDHDALITQLSQTTGLEPQVASQLLMSNEWNIEAAASDYYASLDEPVEEGSSSSAPQAPQPPSGAGTLDGNYVPQPIPTASSLDPSANTKPPQPKKKFATLGDLGGGSAAGHAHDDDHEDDDDEDQDLFAGGEKSGLAVQNPDDLKKRILEKARRGGARPGGNDAEPVSNNFRGTARTLGGDDAPSRVIEDSTTNQPRPRERVERHLHFWNNGFSVDDGPLHDSSDPENARILNMIRRGQAPLSLMNVTENQEVDVRLEQHDGPYVASKKKYKPFGGSGQRLGSPTPGVSGPSSSLSEAGQSSAPAASTPTQPAEPARPSVDSSQPTVSLQIRLGDGTRLVSRFNLSHTISDIYDFVNASNPASQARAWVLMTTFPSKELGDKGAKLEDTPELKKGGVVIQKWT